VIQLQVLSGKQAGSEMVVRRFPFLVGRGAQAQLRLEDAGVWDRHLQIDFRRGEGFTFQAESTALTLVNGVAAESGIVRNGDLIELGSVQMRFWLAKSEQRSLRLREALTWASLFVLFGAQIALICWLLR
jgi:hypothetical protein